MAEILGASRDTLGDLQGLELDSGSRRKRRDRGLHVIDRRRNRGLDSPNGLRLVGASLRKLMLTAAEPQEKRREPRRVFLRGRPGA